METLPSLLVLGLLAQQVFCQLPFNPAMLAMAGGGGGAGGGLGALAGLGMAGAEMGGSMTDMLMMQALTNQGGSTGASTGSGGLDPMTLMLLGGGGAGGGSSDMLQTMMMMNMFNGNQGGGGQQTSAATNIANMLAGGESSNSDMTPGQQNALWGVVQMSGNTQRIMDAVTTPTDRVAMERDGLPGVNPMMTIAMCPRPTNCGFAFCENTEIPFTAESFYICRGCPRCRMESNQRNIMNLMRMGGSGGLNPAQAMLMANTVGQGSPAPAMTPDMMVALMNMQQQQTQQATPSPVITLSGVPNTPPKPVQAPASIAPTDNKGSNQPPSPSSSSVPRPPPAFIKAMREMTRQMRAQMMKNNSPSPVPSPSAPTP